MLLLNEKKKIQKKGKSMAVASLYTNACSTAYSLNVIRLLQFIISNSKIFKNLGPTKKMSLHPKVDLTLKRSLLRVIKL